MESQLVDKSQMVIENHRGLDDSGYPVSPPSRNSTPKGSAEFAVTSVATGCYTSKEMIVFDEGSPESKLSKRPLMVTPIASKKTRCLRPRKLFSGSDVDSNFERVVDEDGSNLQCTPTNAKRPLMITANAPTKTRYLRAGILVPRKLFSGSDDENLVVEDEDFNFEIVVDEDGSNLQCTPTNAKRPPMVTANAPTKTRYLRAGILVPRKLFSGSDDENLVVEDEDFNFERIVDEDGRNLQCTPTNAKRPPMVTANAPRPQRNPFRLLSNNEYSNRFRARMLKPSTTRRQRYTRSSSVGNGEESNSNLGVDGGVVSTSQRTTTEPARTHFDIDVTNSLSCAPTAAKRPRMASPKKMNFFRL